ncbi:MAG: hypothetical protein ACM3MG_01145 [Bacillota bacterium]
MQFLNKKATALIKILIFSSMATGCSMDLNITDPTSESPSVDVGLQRTSVDFTSTEIVTTGSGVVFSGSFGEISEKKTLSNGVTFDGVFYE